MEKRYFKGIQIDAHRTKKILFFGMLFVVNLAAVSAPVANAQEQTASEIIAALESRADALENIASLERLAARIVYVESVALLSHYGEWPGEGDAGWQEDSIGSEWTVPKFFYDVNNINSRFSPELFTLRRNANREGVFTSDELERFMMAVDDFEKLIESSQVLYGFLQAGEIEMASEYLRLDIRTHYFNITAGSYTINSGVLRDIDAIRRLARSIE